MGTSTDATSRPGPVVNDVPHGAANAWAATGTLIGIALFARVISRSTRSSVFAVPAFLAVLTGVAVALSFDIGTVVLSAVYLLAFMAIQVNEKISPHALRRMRKAGSRRHGLHP